jgi:PhzF family phenazine biosynthesis protein
MLIPFYQVDAFAEELFTGNPAGVCPLEHWISDDLMQKIAAENNLAETAFFVKDGSRYQLRWFTPTTEVDLCGHATLASAHVLFRCLGINEPMVEFGSKSGPLKVFIDGEYLVLDFPSDKICPMAVPPLLAEGIGMNPLAAYRGISDYMLVLENQGQVEQVSPDFSKIIKADARGVIITAKGKDCDFVSRFFAPQCGINEDPVTGSAHTTLTPYWAEKLGKTEMTAMQLSKRKGWLKCRYHGDRVEIGGKAFTYLTGSLSV